MLDTTQRHPCATRFHAVLETLPGSNPDGRHHVRLYHNTGWTDAMTWLTPNRSHPDAFLWGEVTLLRVEAQVDLNILLALDNDVIPVLSNMLDEFHCPIDGVVQEVTELIDQLSNTDLRRFVTRALVGDRKAFTGFWTSPASRRDHHAYPGGLAQHSLQIARMVKGTPDLPEEYRELGIVHGLLHDYGKIWCYDPSTGPTLDSRHHVAIGLHQLGDALHELTERDPTLGAAMRELLGGARMPRNIGYPLAVGRIVHAFDQASCELTRGSPLRLATPADSDMWF